MRSVAGGPDALARDVRRGLSSFPKTLPPKYFYDDLGSQLFDRICDTPEYYLTRSEHALLRRISDQLVQRPAPDDIVELGSGAARKTRLLLDAVARSGQRCRYVPFDVSESMLEYSATALLEEYPWLIVRGVVGDYERDLDALPAGDRRLLLFLGSTIGNFDALSAIEFLSRIAKQLAPEEKLLLGTDLVKEQRVLDAAYNDAQGITAEFNKNVLRVINRELGGHFVLERFAHIAYFDPDKSQVEMYVESKVAQRVRIDRLDLEVKLDAGERILTEISRKFTRESATEMLGAAGFALESWFVSPDRHFALSLAKRA